MKVFKLLVLVICTVTFLPGCLFIDYEAKIKNEPLSVKKLDYSNRLLTEIPVR